MFKISKKSSAKNKFLYITILLVFASGAMIAHGLRMMIQGLLYPASFYPAPLPTTLDFWFDWFILFFLGSLVMIIAVKRWMEWMHKPKTG